MPVETLTYTSIADRLGFRALLDRLWSPRQRVSGAVVAVDLAERRTVTARSPDADQSAVAQLTARIETLGAELAKVEAAAAVHRADFERERERCERLMGEMLKTTADLMAAREAAARLAGELEALKARPWWRRLAG
jgi:hypothetical protein